MLDLEFYQNKRVFVTGHTGFVGSWLCHMLIGLGARVFGYALNPQSEPNLYTICGLSGRMDSFIADIRDFETLKTALNDAKPDIVIHLAAQPFVREGYINPQLTYDTNVMGTVNLMECIRTMENPPLSVLNVTTDKVYLNNEAGIGFQEDDPLDGFDPYSNSKSCSELVTHCYKNSFLDAMGIALSTARAGNIIGGGDFGQDRIIPDCIEAAQNKETIVVRNPHSIRPYQHVLESVFAYLLIARKQYNHLEYADYYNIGPDEKDCQTTGEIATLFCMHWGEGMKWKAAQGDNTLHEASYLKLNCAKMKQSMDWNPIWGIDTAVAKTVEWAKVFATNGNIQKLMDDQITEFLKK
jgi:CDP-glucose 4,6-dehydratase